MANTVNASDFNALSPTADINTVVGIVNAAAGGATAVRPDLFYSKQLLETIRLGADQYPYYRLAEPSPIPDKSRKLQLRRWTPLQAHTVPLAEGIPPTSDKGSVETYEIETYSYGRYMEFSDRVDLDLIDPIIANYTKEYSIVAVETLDLLARDALLSIANEFYAGQAANFEGLKLGKDPATGVEYSKPTMADLRLIVLALKKQLVKPRLNGKFQVICSPEFTYDMISDEYVQKYMRYNNTTATMYENGSLVSMFDMEFYESMATLNSGEFYDGDEKALRLYRQIADGTFEYLTIHENDVFIDGAGKETPATTTASGWVNDKRTGEAASYIPNQLIWDIAELNRLIAVYGSGSTIAFTIKCNDGTMTAYNPDILAVDPTPFSELKAQHTLIVGKDALIRTGMSGQDNAKMYVKAKGSSGVLDPIDQRQSIGFKINSVGFGSARNEAVVDYINIPTTLNLTWDVDDYTGGQALFANGGSPEYTGSDLVDRPAGFDSLAGN